MRRLLLGLLAGALAFVAGNWLVVRETGETVVHSSGSCGYTMPGHEYMLAQWELYPSPSAAADEFNAQLRVATEYTEFAPCFDGAGRRRGDRAVMLLDSPYVPAPTWRIAWTYRAENLSEFYSVESSLLSDARYLEERVRKEQEENVRKRQIAGHPWKWCYGKGGSR